MSEARAVPAKLPDPALPGADWADAFEIVVPGKRFLAIEAARQTLGRTPAWARRLLWLRNALARLVGLKTGPDKGIGDSQRVGIFPILLESEDRVVLGLDDWHLDFRIVVEVAPEGDGGSRIRATTLVRRKNLFGRLYIGLVTPFHRVIVPTTLPGPCDRKNSYFTAVSV
jgi:hypothetical protein